MHDPKLVFDAIDQELRFLGTRRDLIICGGAALIAMGVVARETRDVDVLVPLLDDQIKSIAERIAGSFGLKAGWLNNGPKDLIQELPNAWESRCTIVFEGKNLTVRSIGRVELICSKLYAAADRPEHLPDLIALRPSEEELQYAAAWVLERDASQIWPQIVGECTNVVRERLGYGRS